MHVTHSVYACDEHNELGTHLGHTHWAHDTHSLFVCTLPVLLTWSPIGNYNIIIQYSCLPILHLLPVHPGSQTQVAGLLQTPFSQGGTQTAEERVQQMATWVDICGIVFDYFLLLWLESGLSQEEKGGLRNVLCWAQWNGYSTYLTAFKNFNWGSLK